MIEVIIPWIGVCAAVLTSLSYIPQVRKAWPRGSTDDLSLKMLITLTAGLLLWIAYGLLKSDWVIVAANCVGAILSGSVLAFKIRDMRSGTSPRH
ncbi:SemiSWEET transporter [Bradyrhizobium sp.]|jgi:MtN3 and saliva related transmembrane protein|uniref:SemiSWEET family sugar transporter n=1 Tax=Bradyrhizobium sp. TaxID=376 RepID=UPI002DFE645E|nr:SemiSWEET transporter [Bradyrhizobium sp.]